MRILWTILCYIILFFYPDSQLCRSPSIMTTTPIPTTTIGACSTPNATIGLTIDSNTSTEQFGVEQLPSHVCNSCSTGLRNFYAPHTRSSGLFDALIDQRASLSVSCPNPNDTCVCASGVCCQLQAEFTSILLIIPYCDPSNNCRNNVFLDIDSIIMCDDGRNLTRNDQFDVSADPLPLNSNVYPEADSVSCSGCESIRSASCQGPTVEI